MPRRIAAWCGLLAPVAFVVGWLVGGIAQPADYSSVHDTISDLGALTARSPWLYNQVGANLTGLLVVGFALGLWPVVRGTRTGRLGVAALVVVGVGQLLDGFLRLDCRAIDGGCQNTSWHAEAHEIESVVTILAELVAPFLLWRALRGLSPWRDLARVSLLAGVATAVILLGVFPFAEGLSQRADSTIWFLWLGVLAYRLLRPSAPGEAELLSSGT